MQIKLCYQNIQEGPEGIEFPALQLSKKKKEEGEERNRL